MAAPAVQDCGDVRPGASVRGAFHSTLVRESPPEAVDTPMPVVVPSSITHTRQFFQQAYYTAAGVTTSK